MSRSLAPASLVLLLTATGCTQEQLEDLLFDTYLIKLDTEPAEVVTTVNNIATVFDVEPIHIFELATQGFQVDLPIGVADEIASWDEVQYVVIDNPDTYTPPPGFEAPELGDGEVPEGIERIGGAVTTVDFSGIGVAVIDTGVDLDHPDLNVAGGVDIVGQASGGDNGGADGHGHGTHVAGTIGAIADGEGVAGVAPGIDIYAVRVLDDNGSGTYGNIIAGLEWVLGQPEIRVVNMSLGGAGDPSSNTMLEDAIQAVIDAGVVVCIAAGNDGTDTAGFVPAGYDLGIVVSAYDSYGGDNGFAYFSNYGDEVDIAAPGMSITSTYPDDTWASLSGTSMATPHVAGAAAAYLAKYPALSPAEVLADMLATAEDGFAGQGGNNPEPLLDVAALLDN